MSAVSFKTGQGTAASDERALRIELAAAYRAFAVFGWTETIFNHITVRVPGPEHHFLINPFGLLYDHVSASNLVKIDLEGRPVGQTPSKVNPAGFIIHSAFHMARPDAQCVIHWHSPAGMAIAQLEGGLEFNHFIACQFYGRLAYHEFEGLTLDPDEKERLLAHFGDSSVAMVLRNHGMLVIGRTVGEAVWRAFNLERMCDQQLRAMATGAPRITPPRHVLEKSARQVQGLEDRELDLGGTVLTALMRKLDQQDPSYRD
ncbi:MAG: class II aldolase/adducin family protein [Rhodospirillaceae bacterium]|nr:class II aldolase/adducin family protein [Rhodospirillaceae bacterium]